MRWWFRSFLARAGTILVYGYGVVVAPTLHHAFHRPDHVHVGDSIIYLPEQERSEAAEHGHNADADDDDHDHHESEAEEPGHHHSDDHDEHSGLSGDPHHEHHHHDHDDHDHGGSSIWHFGAALGDHLDRTPLLGAGTGAVHLLRLERPPEYRPVTTGTLRLRGPPRIRAA